MGDLPKFHVEDNSYFITSNINHKIPVLKNPKYLRILIQNLEFYRNKFNFRLLGYVLNYDHIHLIIFPDFEKGNTSEIMRDFKKYTAKEIIADLKKNDPKLLHKFLLPSPRKKNNIYKIWQTKTYDFNIYSERKFLEKLNYIHMNPVKHGIVKDVEDWPYSSFHNYNCNHKTKIEINYIDL